MINYLIKIEYEGTHFVGWQSQKNGKSIQDSIEKVLKKILKAKINAFSPNPGCWFELNGSRVKIIKAKKIISKGIPGTILGDNFTIACSKNALQIIEIKKEGKQKMTAEKFLRGNKIKTGQSLN